MHRPFVKNFISLGILTGASSSAAHRNVNAQNEALEIESIQATVASSSSSSKSSEESIEDQISDSISSCSAPAPSVLKKAVAAAQLNEKDIDIAMKNVFSRPDLLEPFVAPHVNCSGLENREVKVASAEKKIFKAVKLLLTDQLLLEDICSNLYTARTAVNNSKICTGELEQMRDEDADEPMFQTGNIGRTMHRANIWESICLSHGCSLCLDVLACPVISNCSHTFCGECLDAYMVKVCEDASSSPSVAHYCPLCKEEIVSVTFERIFHRDICEKIASAGLCANDNPAMAEWKRRCEVYEQKMQQNRVHKICGRNDHDSDDDNNERNEDDFTTSVFFLALTVVLIVVIAKARM